MATNGTGHNASTTELDVLIIGGGFGGCYLLKLLRDNDFKTRLVEAAPRLGGVWAHNRYPVSLVVHDPNDDHDVADIPELESMWKCHAILSLIPRF